ncbi:MAG TPA: flippase activity-associated protein Agl23 [Anaerolineales bacterium]|nr:flippase activity-associated protein Agl23 [Anaerolineales bacterium]
MNNENTPWLQKPIHANLPAITNEIALFAGIMLLALITRFYDLGTRVMSHDESLHTYFSWLLYRGQGYQHSPMMHGPYQFHIIALSYFLFGVSDFTARIPAVLFSIATVWMVWYWRRYLGTWGMIVAGLLMVISPYMLYYGRYVRNESYVGFSGILFLYTILRYIESGDKKYLYLVTAATVLHFTAKETAFIYTAQALLFLGVYFITRVTRQPWGEKYSHYRVFVILLAVTLLLASVGAGFALTNLHSGTLNSTETAAPADPTGVISPLTTQQSGPSISTILFSLAAVGLIAALVVLFLGYGWANLLQERSFDLLVLLGTFVLPMLIPFPIKWLEGRLNVILPTDAASVSSLDQRSLAIIAAFVITFFIISIVIGLLWNREWWKYGAFYWGVFTILYTTVFTNAPGFFTGLIGSLGYWIVQQGVERGSQPEYYYVLVQIPMYEYLPALGSFVAIGWGLIKLFGRNQVKPESPAEIISEAGPTSDSNDPVFGVFFGLMAWWSVSSIVAFTVAGERMPWLTYHMAWPMVLFTGWVVGQIIESLAPRIKEEKPWRSLLAIFVFAVFALAIFNMLRSFYGATPPFQGTELAQLQATSAFLFPLLTAFGSGALLFMLMRKDLLSLGIVTLFILGSITVGASVINGALLLSAQTNGVDQTVIGSYWLKFGLALLTLLASIAGMMYLARFPRTSPFLGLATLTIFGLLAVQTLRTSFRANYINYNDATEYLVYAHGAGGIKEVMTQVEEISERTAGGLNAIVAYDASAPDTGVSWPMVWYLRDYTALRSFDQPTRSLRDAVAVIVDQKNFDKIEPALGDGFYKFDYIRMWWPNQDYFNLDRTRVLNAITDPGIREGIFDIWFNRDYTRYGQAVGSTSLTLTTWQPADQMRLYVRKDVASKIWNYGVGPREAPLATDPYEAGTIILPADQIFGSDRYLPPGLNAPRSIAAGLNADMYIADSRNHRILHIATDGRLLHEWGTFADLLTSDAPTGTFNEPWGVAVGPDGSIYVTDTWNHRVQKFSEEGKAIKTWGQYGQPVPEIPESQGFFWGPRGIDVDSEGRVYVADTGNKRIVIFDENGNYLTEFGTAGFDAGQFDEPVGVAVANDGRVYVSDTWNQRIQSFIPSEASEGTGEDLFFLPLAQWDVNAWFGQSLENKPFITVDSQNHVFVTDPGDSENVNGFRVIEFTEDGQFIRTWGEFGDGPAEIGLAAGVTVDSLGNIWVTDAGNNRILKYNLP